MEGCSGVASSEQVAADVGKQLMAGDMNSCIAGCFAAGATEVVVRDIHGGGRNVNPQVIDRRAKLIQGSTPEKRFKDVEGSAAIILLGYHAMSLTPGGTLDQQSGTLTNTHQSVLSSSEECDRIIPAHDTIENIGSAAGSCPTVDPASTAIVNVLYRNGAFRNGR